MLPLCPICLTCLLRIELALDRIKNRTKGAKLMEGAPLRVRYSTNGRNGNGDGERVGNFCLKY